MNIQVVEVGWVPVPEASVGATVGEVASRLLVGPVVVRGADGSVTGLIRAGDLPRAVAEGRAGEEVTTVVFEPLCVRAGAELDLDREPWPVVVVGEGGEPLGIVRKEAAQAAYVRRLSQRLHKLRTALDAAYNGVIVVDAGGRVAATNRAFGEVVGLEPVVLVGRPIHEIVPNTGLPEVLATGRARIGVRILIGGNTYLSNRSPIVEEGRVVGAVAVLQDVTALETARAERDEAVRLKHVLETVLDTAYEGVVVVDEDGVISMFNRAYGEFLGVDPADMVGRPVTEAIENTRMHIVLDTGEAELRQVQCIKGHEMVCDRVPIREGDRVVGAVGKVLFRDVRELDALFEEARRLRSQVEFYEGELRRQNGTRYSLESLVGRSEAMSGLKDLVHKVARTQSTVLIQGESGTGKELVAHAIHNLSRRAGRTFVKVNCAALPEGLLESELFGYREGAFTGARRGGQLGKFELAEGGSIFFDEVGELSPATQAKLLRVLQEREFERLGEGTPVPVDVRVMAATNRDLRALVGDGHFRADLLYRLNVVNLEVPPLRARREDIPLLVEHLLERLVRTLVCMPKGVPAETLGLLLAYPWPGNVRELENVLERSLNLCDGTEIEPTHLPLHLRQPAERGEGLVPLRHVVAEAEAEHLRRALDQAGGNAMEAARLVGIGKSSFYEKAARHHLFARPMR